MFRRMRIIRNSHEEIRSRRGCPLWIGLRVELEGFVGCKDSMSRPTEGSWVRLPQRPRPPTPRLRISQTTAFAGTLPYRREGNGSGQSCRLADSQPRGRRTWPLRQPNPRALSWPAHRVLAANEAFELDPQADPQRAAPPRADLFVAIPDNPHSPEHSRSPDPRSTSFPDTTPARQLMSVSLATLAEQWLAWKNTAKPSPATLKARRADLAALGEIIVRQLGLEVPPDEDQFQRWLGALRPSHLDRDTIISAFATYATDHAPSSIRRCRSTWTGFCQWLVVHRQLLDTNPVEFVEPPKARRWRPRPISEEDLARIVLAAQTPYERARDPWPELEQALCALFVGAGLRVSESITVRVGD